MSFKREPAVYVAAIRAIIVVAIAFGVKITLEQLGLIVVALEAIGATIVRQNVYAPVDKQGNPIEVAK